MNTQAQTPNPVAEMQLITEYAQPIATYLREHRNPHCIVVITDNLVRLVSTEFNAPLTDEVTAQTNPSETSLPHVEEDLDSRLSRMIRSELKATLLRAIDGRLARNAKTSILDCL
ncbi:hypothetical protein FACS18948_3040 [Clostridia bacterium]|nr:hypothetical protein FACS18948_3040 [Clostridia bacterium]